MKKIFTLLAAAAIAVSANAQGTYAVPETQPTDGQVITSVPNITMTYGTGYKENKQNYLYGENSDSPFTYYTQGTANVTFDADGVPSTGAFYEFKPEKNGVLEVAAVIGNGKEFFVMDNGVNMPITGYTLIGNKIDEATGEYPIVTPGEDNKLAAKFYGLIKFDVVAGHTYYTYMKGSKMSFYGFNYTVSDDSSAITDITVDENAPVEYFNLQGIRVDNPENGLYIKRQGNTVTKVLVK